MAKRKKYPKLPNGFGSIRYLGEGRRNPYAVHPPATERTSYGFKPAKALCYVDSWTRGFLVLNAYKAGTYTPGMEIEVPDSKQADVLIQRLLADYNRITGNTAEERPTFSQVYKDFWKYKYESGKEYSKSSKDATTKGYKNCKPLHEKTFADLKHADLQKVIDACPHGTATKEFIVTFLKQIYRYAIIYELVEKNQAAHIQINTSEDDEHGTPFSKEELEILWKNQDNETISMILIMCYSGFRLTAYKSLEANLEEGFFKGGIKTAASKGRIVPIHSAILPLVERRMSDYGELMPESTATFRKSMYAALEALQIGRHTPHDCRHTFSALCEEYKVAENDRKRMLGHSFGADITNRIYGHRTLDDLRTEIEKIVVTNL